MELQKLKRIISSFAICALSITCLTGCSPKYYLIPKEKTIVRELEKQYPGEDFEFVQFLSKPFLSGYTNSIVRSVDDGFAFNATYQTDGLVHSDYLDEYLERRVAEEFKRNVDSSLGEITVFVDMWNHLNGVGLSKDMSVDEYLDAYKTPAMHVTLIVDADKNSEIDINKLYYSIQNITGGRGVKGNLSVYLSDTDLGDDCVEYFEESDKIYYDQKEHMSPYFVKSFDVEDGKVDINLEDLQRELMGSFSVKYGDIKLKNGLDLVIYENN